MTRHKWLVFLEGRRHGASLRSRLLHDADKFRPGYLWHWIVRDEVEYCDRLHRTRAPHQWEWWCTVPSAVGPPSCRPMSDEARRELLSDWCAKQRARGGGPTDYARRVKANYEAHREEIHLHPETRAWIETRLEELTADTGPEAMEANVHYEAALAGGTSIQKAR